MLQIKIPNHHHLAPKQKELYKPTTQYVYLAKLQNGLTLSNENLSIRQITIITYSVKSHKVSKFLGSSEANQTSNGDSLKINRDQIN